MLRNSYVQTTIDVSSSSTDTTLDTSGYTHLDAFALIGHQEIVRIWNKQSGIITVTRGVAETTPFDIPAGTPLRPIFPASYSYGPVSEGAISVGVDTIYYTPLWIREETTITETGVWVETAGSSEYLYARARDVLCRTVAWRILYCATAQRLYSLYSCTQKCRRKSSTEY